MKEEGKKKEFELAFFAYSFALSRLRVRILNRPGAFSRTVI